MNYYGEMAPDLAGVFDAPAKMRAHERLLIYALVVGLRPERVLEIGTDVGGTAWIIVAAMNAAGCGRLVCVDPRPTAWESEFRLKLAERAALVAGRSPEALDECARLAGGPFDLILIDGNHEYDGVLADIEGLLPYVRDKSRLLIHDCLYAPTMDAIREALRTHGDVLHDAGMLAAQPIEFQGTTQGGLYSLFVRLWGG